MSIVGENPCVTCGACCASFRVVFTKSELQQRESIHPKALSTEVIDFGGAWVGMKGTENKHRPACRCLQGRIGKVVSCSIYNYRPSPCRNFEASYENGIHQPKCDEARRRHGLAPLGLRIKGEVGL